MDSTEQETKTRQRTKITVSPLNTAHRKTPTLRLWRLKDKAHHNKDIPRNKKEHEKGGGQKRRKETIRTIKSYHSQSQR
jgi:hypothetical protein